MIINIFVLSENYQNAELIQNVKNVIDKSTLQNYINVKHTCLDSAQIKPCIGCFGCWIKTPGECVLKDSGRDILKDFIQTDLTIIICSMVFGNYSFPIKTAIDRFIPNDVFFFTQYKGETHHVKRYETRPNILFIGVQDELNKAEEDTFMKLCSKNATNLCANKHSVLTFHSCDTQKTIEQKVWITLKTFITNVEVAK